MRRGALQYAFATAIILIIFAMIALLFASNLYANVWSIDPDQERCVNQILGANQISKFTKGTQSTEIDCPTKNVTIEAGTSDDEIKNILGQSMYNCWELWGSGKLLLFDDTGTYCHICQRTKFEDPRPVQNFNNYLASFPEQGMTFLEQLGNSKIPEDQIGTRSDSFDTTNDLITVLAYHRGVEYIFDSVGFIEDNPQNVAGFFLAGTAAAATAAILAPVGLVGGSILFILGTGTAATLSVDHILEFEPKFSSGVYLVEDTAEGLLSIGCQELV